MKRRSVALVACIAALCGAALTLWAILPLPPVNDLREARGWGYGASVGAFVLGLPFSFVLIPLAVAIHPFPDEGDGSDAWIVAAMLTTVVAINWGLCAATVARLGARLFRR